MCYIIIFRSIKVSLNNYPDSNHSHGNMVNILYTYKAQRWRWAWKTVSKAPTLNPNCDFFFNQQHGV